jgi:Endonuclease-reverse transcriptase
VQSGEASILDDLRTALTRRGRHLVVGDFNLHHPLWAGPEYPHTDAAATDLIDLMDDRGLEQLVPPGTTTYETRGAKTTIDLVWASYSLAEQLIRCEARREWWHGADHIPIHTEFSLVIPKAPVIKRKQWHATDWDLFTSLFRSHSWIPQPLPDQESIDHAVAILVESIHQAADQATPIKTITGHSRPGYTPEMAALKATVTQRRRHARHVDTEEA